MSSFTITHDPFLDAAGAYTTGVDRQPGYWAGKQSEPKFLNRVPEGGYTAPTPPTPVKAVTVTPPPLPTGLAARYRHARSVASLMIILNPHQWSMVKIGAAVMAAVILIGAVFGVR